ncbi:rhomboid-domain-containing protein [Mytilinidion resinicola]|uniref:Rhomboid-type serine protease n=1 Tax=Mytilinidion resinicola TaxID=574789 RepID=A0A6A6Z9E8_9PEZI|nr:rhomboid-domain-containing protein [Mytilinidion resinicola]KAF2817636.1 rhomboid-domain-containing protein [Mytilinidion resinicola]
MAANDYYNDPPLRINQPLPPDPHLNNPLPPTPLSTSPHPRPTGATPISPVASPFDDHTYPDYPTTSRPTPSNYGDTGYHGAGGGYQQNPYHDSSDPFTDQNAIPLHSQQSLQGKMDASPTRYNADPESRFPREKKKKGWFSGKITWVVYILTTVQIGVFIGELIKNAVLTKSPIEIHPQFNIMIGPSPYVLINMGARFTPCMHNVHNVTDFQLELPWQCPNSTTNNAECTLSQLCGFGGVPYQKPGTPLSDRSHEPDQWFRFIVPMFLHAGIIHIGFNMLLQLTLGRDMEREIGSLRFAVVYFSSGIFGFVLGGNYAAPSISSTGASGSLFGIIALVLLDLFYNWSTRRSPVKDLLFILLDIAISFVLGLLPGLDNFSHIGGFLCGLVLGICLLRSPPALRERVGADEPPYAAVDTMPLVDGEGGGIKKFAKQPLGFFKGRKPFWWAWWLFRAGCLTGVIVGFILLLKNFYVWRNECSWCKHLSCLPVSNWCDIGAIRPEIVTTNTTSRRDLFGLDGLASLPLGAF